MLANKQKKTKLRRQTKYNVRVGLNDHLNPLL